MNVCSPEEKLLQNESSQVELAGTTVDLIYTLNQSLFKSSLEESFPVKLVVSIPSNDIKKEVEKIALNLGAELTINRGTVEIYTSKKNISNKIIEEFCDKGLDITFDYSKLISHPGLLFVKRLTTNKVKSEELKVYFNSQTKYKSLNETNLIKSKNNESYAILKFDNYLDCEYILSNFHHDFNPFHEDPNIPMYLNKYISKKERALKDPQYYTNSTDQFTEENVYSSIVVENLNNFFKDCNLTIKEFNNFLSVFQSFHPIEFILFPVKSSSGKDNITLENFGYIYFKSTPDMNMNVLRCLYFLNNLTLNEIKEFDHNIKISLEQEIEIDVKKENTLKLSINQHRFNHYLHSLKPNQLVISFKTEAFMNCLDYNMYSQVFEMLSKTINYQETNIYVNNLSSLFENDDKLWEEFWSQFGEIKSAKIIKPEFYSKKVNNYGRIGFIFYMNFKMALKAIILTNSKIVEYKNQTIAIKSSFAIQKSQNHMVSQLRQSRSPPSYYLPPQYYNGTTLCYPMNYAMGYYTFYNPYYYMSNPNVNNFQPQINDTDDS